eukprot:3063654-Rhodomonas_salina.2
MECPVLTYATLLSGRLPCSTWQTARYQGSCTGSSTRPPEMKQKQKQKQNSSVQPVRGCWSSVSDFAQCMLAVPGYLSQYWLARVVVLAARICYPRWY